MSDKQKPADHCECPSKGVLNPGMASYYDAESELPFVNHEPGKCKCTNDLALFKCKDGVIRTLCSCCSRIGDKRI